MYGYKMQILSNHTLIILDKQAYVYLYDICFFYRFYRSWDQSYELSDWLLTFFVSCLILEPGKSSSIHFSSYCVKIKSKAFLSKQIASI